MTEDMPDLWSIENHQSVKDRIRIEMAEKRRGEPVVIFVPEREHVTSGVPCWCNPDTSEKGLVIHRGGN